VQTTSGHENKVRMLIQRKIDADPAAADARAIRQALVPTEQVVEIKNGKKVTVERKVFPGYVLVEMAVSEETLHTINTIK
jgi:transcriptional antiterminator NusG